jgi:hypothetical protein
VPRRPLMERGARLDYERRRTAASDRSLDESVSSKNLVLRHPAAPTSPWLASFLRFTAAPSARKAIADHTHPSPSCGQGRGHRRLGVVWCDGHPWKGLFWRLVGRVWAPRKPHGGRGRRRMIDVMPGAGGMPIVDRRCRLGNARMSRPGGHRSCTDKHGPSGAATPRAPPPRK